jgi:hypothetical protein
VQYGKLLVDGCYCDYEERNKVEDLETMSIRTENIHGKMNWAEMKST